MRVAAAARRAGHSPRGLASGRQRRGRGPTPRSVWTLWITGAALLIAGAVALPTALAAQSSPLDDARAALVRGEYESALERLDRVSDGGSEAAIVRLRALRALGRYDDALDLLGGRSGPAPSPRLERWKGELLLEVGAWDAAEAAFERSVAAGAPDAALARVLLGEQAFRRGRWQEARAVFDSFIDLYNSGAADTGAEMIAVAHAVGRLGRENPDLFQDALRAWDEAIELLPGDPRPIVAVGDLFLDRYTSTRAMEEYARALSVNAREPDALHGRARALDFDGSGRALAVANEVLETNPNHVGARTLLAEIRLRAENVPAAVEEAETALETNPRSLEALSVLAAARYLAGDEEGWIEARDRVLALNPSWAGLYVRLAELSADARRYADAVDFAREAVARDSLSWEGWGLLGINQMRTQEVVEGRENVARAFDGDPYNPWFKNTLDLLDLMDDFETVRSENFEIVLPPGEAALLGPRVIALAEEAFAEMTERYGTSPPTPIRLELFPTSADFSVRTFGLVGLGALGVSFGSTLVMDSPTAREPGDFNWASTLWHEIAHAFHLAISDHAVPRWFSEGLAVREQRVARPHWGFRAGVPWLQAWTSERMPPLSRMNEAFVRPAFPAQLAFGYFQASLAFDWIEERWGFQAIRDFLEGYGRGATTNQLTRIILGLDDEELDAEFQRYVDARFESEIAALADLAPVFHDGPGDQTVDAEATVEEILEGMTDDLDILRSQARLSPGSFPARLRLGQALVRAGWWDEAEENLRAAQRLFPAYPGLDGPLAGLARVHQARGEVSEAAGALRALGELNESAWSVAVEEARLRAELGDVPGELRALRRALEIHPFAVEPQTRLATLAGETGAWDEAASAWEAVVALEPADPAQVWYELSRARLRSGDRAGARTAVLRALEIAPSFDAALELLLEIRGGGR